MAYTVPFTAVTGTIIQASDWNTSGRDNIAHMKGMLAGNVSELVSPLSWGDRPVGVLPAFANTGGGAAIYTVPANTVAILTGVMLAAVAADTVSVKDGGDRYIVKSRLMAPNTSLEVECFRVLTAGQTVKAIATGGNTNIHAYPIVWEVPSSYTGVLFRAAASAGAVTAATATTIISPTSGKTLVVRHLAVEMTASGGRLLLRDDGGRCYRFWPSTGAGELVSWSGEIIVPSGASLQIYADDGATSWAVGAWETV
jgi:hypothetical protein